MKKEPRRNMYIGHRYVPKIMGEWDKRYQYEGLSIVTYKGGSYTSKKRVPVGIDILDNEYWVLTGNYNAQIEEYRQDVERLSQDVEKTTQESLDNTNKAIKYFNDKLDEDLENQNIKISKLGVTPLDFNAKGDGLTDDTAALQETINYCQENELILHSTNEYEYLTSGNIINEYLELSGTFNLKAKEDKQEYVLKIDSKVNSKATLNINGDYKSLYGILASNFGRSKFYTIDTVKNKLWGMKYLPLGNNNFIQYDFFRASSNGYREEIRIKKISESDNVTTSLSGYGTYELPESIDNIYKHNKESYFIIHNGEAYKVKRFSGNNIEVYNFDIGEINEDITITFISGGGLDILKHGDNGVGTFNNMDLFSNKGIGMNHESLYSHKILNLVAQGNGIGFTCSGYSLGTTLISPYFELNKLDMVVSQYLKGVMTHGIFNPEKFQTLNGRVIKKNNFKGISGLEIVSYENGGLTSGEIPLLNSSDIIASPGFSNNYEISSVSQQFNVTLDNTGKSTAFKNFTAILNLTCHDTTMSKKLTINLSNNEDTIEGKNTYETTITGNTTVILSRVLNDWKVNILTENIYNNVSKAPVKIGQISVVSGQAYISTGTNSPNDWKQITN